jgi:hypothetical protein
MRRAVKRAGSDQRTGGQMRGGKGSGGLVRPCKATDDANRVSPARSAVGATTLADSIAGGAAMQVAPQTATVGAQGVPLQSVHGSSHGAAATAVLGREPNAATETPAARTARQPSRPARRRKRVTAPVSPRTWAAARRGCARLCYRGGQYLTSSAATAIAHSGRSASVARTCQAHRMRRHGNASRSSAARLRKSASTRRPCRNHASCRARI